MSGNAHRRRARPRLCPVSGLWAGGRARVTRGPRARIRLHASSCGGDGNSHTRSHSTPLRLESVQARSPRVPGWRSRPSCPQRGRTPGRAGLLAVQLSALAHVVRPAPLAPGLVPTEVGKRQALRATTTAPHLDSPGWWRGLRHGGRQRRSDVPGPHACRAERDSKLACDRPQRLALRAKSSGLPLRAALPRSHTNICSQRGQTY